MKKILALLFLFVLAWESKGQCEEQAQGNFRPTKQKKCAKNSAK